MRRFLRRLLVALVATLVVILAALPFAVPAVVEHIVSREIAAFGFLPDVRMSLGYCWRNGPGLSGDMHIALVDTPWRLSAKFGCSCSEWFASAQLPETSFSETDPLAEALLNRFPLPAVSNLVFSGTVSLDAKAARTFRTPVPVWSVKMPLRDVSVRVVSQDKAYSVEGLSVTPGASGIADRLDILPIFPRIKALDANGFRFSDFRASVRASERALMVTEAEAGFCGGKVNLYSLVLNPKNLSTGFTLFLDDVDAGEALSHLKGFRGEASGRLHGKVKLRVKDGGEAVRLSDAFLYSTPGETGKLRMENPEMVADGLALAGLDEAARGNVANALTDLDYSVLRLDLRRMEGRSARLSVRLGGSATRGGKTVPVDLTINFNGELEQLINTGLGYSAKLKGKKK